MIGITPRTTPIGIELDTETMRAVQLRRSGSQWAPAHAVAVSRLDVSQPFNADDALRLRAVLHRRGFTGRRAVVSLPDRDVIRGLFEVSGSEQADPFISVAKDIERTHHLQPGTYELAAWLPPASGGRRKPAVCVTGCRHDTAHQVLNAFTAAGLEIAALDSRAGALGQAVNTAPQKLTAVLDIQDRSAELILLHDGRAVYQRPLRDAGLDRARQALVERGLSQAAADHALRTTGLASTASPSHQRLRIPIASFVRQLIEEARPALDYAARFYADLPVESLAVVGIGSRVPGLTHELGQRLQLDAATHRRFTQLNATLAPEFAVAVGLALHPQEATWAAA